MTGSYSPQNDQTGALLSTTRAAVIQSFGGPEQLVLGEVPLPEPSGTQVIVDVAARA